MVRVAVSWLFILTASLLTGALLIGLDAPSSDPAHWLARILPIPDVWADDYRRDLDAADHKNRNPAKADLTLAEESATLALQSAPMRPEGWLRLAYVRARSHNALTSDALSAYARSYEIAPVDAAVGAWRINFGLELWSALTPKLRDEVAGELRTLWLVGPAGRAKLSASVLAVHDSQGRAVGEAILQQLAGPKT